MLGNKYSKDMVPAICCFIILLLKIPFKYDYYTEGQRNKTAFIIKYMLKLYLFTLLVVPWKLFLGLLWTLVQGKLKICVDSINPNLSSRPDLKDLFISSKTLLISVRARVPKTFIIETTAMLCNAMLVHIVIGSQPKTRTGWEENLDYRKIPF